MEWNCTLSCVSGEVWTLSLSGPGCHHNPTLRKQVASIKSLTSCGMSLQGLRVLSSREGATFHGLWNERTLCEVSTFSILLDLPTVIWSPNCEDKVWLCYFSNITGVGATHASVPSHPMVLCVRDHSGLRGKHHFGTFYHFLRTQSSVNQCLSTALMHQLLDHSCNAPFFLHWLHLSRKACHNLHRFSPTEICRKMCMAGQGWGKSRVLTSQPIPVCPIDWYLESKAECQVLLHYSLWLVLSTLLICLYLPQNIYTYDQAIKLLNFFFLLK